MRILIVNSGHMMNLGDVAMLQHAAQQLAAKLPGADISVLTDDAVRLKHLIPTATAIPSSTAKPEQRRRLGFIPAAKEMLRQVGHFLPPIIVGASGSPNVIPDFPCTSTPKHAVHAICTADAVVLRGGGMLNDSFLSSGHWYMDHLSLAQTMGKRTAIFGMGMGPLTDALLAQKARTVLCKLDVLGLRERSMAATTLQWLGLDPTLGVTTGDDAIAIACAAGRTSSKRSQIGVNLRLSAASSIPPGCLIHVAEALKMSMSVLGAGVEPLPVKRGPDIDDLDAIYGVAGNLCPPREGVEGVRTPCELIRRISRCRVVVSAAYHTCVFALSLGIPVISLTSTPYYYGKHRGVFEQFEAGSTLLRCDDPNLRDKLYRSIVDWWDVTDEVRAKLASRADAQIESSSDLYAQFARKLKSEGAGEASS